LKDDTQYSDTSNKVSLSKNLNSNQKTGNAAVSDETIRVTISLERPEGTATIDLVEKDLGNDPEAIGVVIGYAVKGLTSHMTLGKGGLKDLLEGIESVQDESQWTADKEPPINHEE